MTYEASDAITSWFSSRRLGLFVHFGLYAIEGWHEQDQMRRRIPRADYAKLAERFNPSDFDADRLVDLAEEAGMEYVCLTTKHHDGYCLWPSEHTDFHVGNSPIGRDLVGELAEACHRRGMALGLYYSVVDWKHPAYPNQGRHHELAGPEPGDVADEPAYIDFLKAQVRELATNYGEVRHFFWDMNVPEWQDESVNGLLRELQPSIVINDRGLDAGDFGTPERSYDADATAGRRPFERPTEACNSVGSQSWGYRADEFYFTPRYLMGEVARTMAKGGHYLLNVGPDATGRVPERAAAVVRRVGDWYGRVREAYGDSEPVVSEFTDLPVTRRGQSYYLHLLDGLDLDTLLLPGLDTLPILATLLNDGTDLDVQRLALPTHWAGGDETVCVRGFPAEGLQGEVPVVRLDFDAEPAAKPVPARYEG